MYYIYIYLTLLILVFVEELIYNFCKPVNRKPLTKEYNIYIILFASTIIDIHVSQINFNLTPLITKHVLSGGYQFGYRAFLAEKGVIKLIGS